MNYLIKGGKDMERRLTEEEYLREKNKKDISLKDFRKIVKEKGYKVKVRTISFQSLGFGSSKHLEIIDMEGNFIVGSGSNVYTKERMEEHPIPFQLLREYRILDENGKKVIT